MANKYLQASQEAQEYARRLRGCLSKKAYESPEAAFQKGQTYYHCRWCNKYHRSGKLAKLLAQVSKPKRRKGAAKWSRRPQ